MKYKAVICDCDGTFVQNSVDALPSPRVIDAVLAAQEKGVAVCLATGRPFRRLTEILKVAGITNPCVISSGAQVVDPITHEVLWEKTVSLESYKMIIQISKDMDILSSLIYGDGITDHPAGGTPERIVAVVAQRLDGEVAEEFINRCNHISELVLHTVPSWAEGKTDVLVTHTLATKQHGVFELAKILQIGTDEIIGIGDGGNDFPLLMACGFKVAMGNAQSELKDIADYVAPSVYDDGVADVIEKYILTE